MSNFVEQLRKQSAGGKENIRKKLKFQEKKARKEYETYPKEHFVRSW